MQYFEEQGKIIRKIYEYAINFKNCLESDVLMHIAGASGSGKTTLGHEIASSYLDIIVKDLDKFDDEAEKMLNYSDVRKKYYTDEMLSKLAKTRQRLMDDFIEISNKPIVFVGHHTEGDHVLHVPTKNRFLLNVNIETSAWRGYQRSQKEDPKYRRTLEELPQDEKEAEKTIDWLLKKGYKPLSHDQILQWMMTTMEKYKTLNEFVYVWENATNTDMKLKDGTKSSRVERLFELRS